MEVIYNEGLVLHAVHTWDQQSPWDNRLTIICSPVLNYSFMSIFFLHSLKL